jgi:hypothetical protein
VEPEHIPESGVLGVGIEPPQVATYPQMQFAQSPDRLNYAASTTVPSVYDTPTRRSPAPPSMIPNKRRAPPQSAFDARLQLEDSQKGIKGTVRSVRKLFGRPPNKDEDEVLSRHFIDRDLVSLPQYLY